MGAPVNPNWHRWIYASISKHLHASTPVPLVVAFTDKRNSAWLNATSKAEAQITGPVTKEQSDNCYRVWADVFIKLTSNLSSNNYDHIDSAGTFANILDQCIECRDYGATGLVVIGSITPRTDDDGIEPFHITPNEKDTQIHSTIEARYEGLFEE